MFQLSRYLYIVDEVRLSFITCLITKRCLKECIFWITEYYYSGYHEDTWFLLGKVYLDFYASLYPKLEKFIIQKYKGWKDDRNIVDVLSVVNNLFTKKPDNHVFLLRQYMLCPDLYASKINRGRRPGWLKKYNSAYYPLLLSLYKEQWENVAYYLRLIADDKLDDLYSTIVYYYKQEFGINIRYNEEELTTKWHNLISVFPHESSADLKHHIILATIIHLRTPEDNIGKKALFIAPKRELIEMSSDWDKPCKKVHNTLREKLIYEIDDTIGCFKLERDKVDDIKTAILMNWDYYMHTTPLWKTRIETYKGNPDHENKQLYFDNDGDKEAFYEKYAYYPDEISEKYYNNIIKIIKKRICKGEKWIITFPDDFSFKY